VFGRGRRNPTFSFKLKLMKRKKMIKEIKRLSKYMPVAKAINYVSSKTPYTFKTVQTYYYTDKARPN
jgi:hypothetical protein